VCGHIHTAESGPRGGVNRYTAIRPEAWMVACAPVSIAIVTAAVGALSAEEAVSLQAIPPV
jgi:hypothetical protein